MSVPKRDQELVQIVDVAFADAARRAGSRLACRPGCTQCCHGAFAINELDALRLAEGMDILSRTDSGLAAKVEARAASWLAEHGHAFPGNLGTGYLGTSDADHARFEEFASDAACPALDPATGCCDLYVWRPMTCRVFGPPIRCQGPDGSEGLAHCELCFTGATQEEVAACEMPISHALEQELLDEIASSNETVVAFALLRRIQK